MQGGPRRRPDALPGGKGYGSNPNRKELRRRRILPVVSRKGAPSIGGPGKFRYVVEQTFALLHQFKCLAVRWERRPELHDALVPLACRLICRLRLNSRKPWSCYKLLAYVSLLRDHCAHLDVRIGLTMA
ncbi:hypothetical protein [Streptomyces luteireticuli]|uniref:Transposase n=1 Tax=Streptomyces luteireticuli TaxID=173858 RepID=A0ABN0Z7R0_9ACTN